jgi:small GTP-binding protein
MDPPPIKAVFAGDSTVGKTSIFRRLESNSFDPHYTATIGGAFARITMALNNGSETDVGLWDTAGQEKFRTIVPIYFQKSDIILIVFDLTQEVTFRGLSEWIELARSRAPQSVRIILVGNKSDLNKKRVVTYTEAEEKAVSFGVDAYVEVSALTGDGFEVLRHEMGNVCGKFFEGRTELDPVSVDPASQSSSASQEGCC